MSAGRTTSDMSAPWLLGRESAAGPGHGHGIAAGGVHGPVADLLRIAEVETPLRGGHGDRLARDEVELHERRRRGDVDRRLDRGIETRGDDDEGAADRGVI